MLDEVHGYKIMYPKNDGKKVGQICVIANNNGDAQIPSYAASLMKKFLDKYSFFGKKTKKNMVMLISEIVDNSMSHTDSDCIISYKHYVVYDNEEKKDKLMISISILNLSESLIYTHIKERLLAGTLECGAKEKVRFAYENVKDKFNNDYDFDSFCMVSAFQKNVTTRVDAQMSSGRGLTKFLEYMLSFAELSYCYAYSGKKLLKFDKKYIHVNEQGNVGFNKTNDYLHEIPDKETMEELDYYNTGALFNLQLVYDWSDLID